MGVECETDVNECALGRAKTAVPVWTWLMHGACLVKPILMSVHHDLVEMEEPVSTLSMDTSVSVHWGLRARPVKPTLMNMSLIHVFFLEMVPVWITPTDSIIAFAVSVGLDFIAKPISIHVLPLRVYSDPRVRILILIEAIHVSVQQVDRVLFVKRIRMNVPRFRVKMAAPASIRWICTPVSALLDFPELAVKPISTNVHLVRVKTVAHVWIASTGLNVDAIGDTLAVNARPMSMSVL